MTSNLYEKDYLDWLEKQAIALKDRKPELLDWDNLLEEIEDLGNSDKSAVESLLTRLYEHVLKIVYWAAERERNLKIWQIEIKAFRQQIKKRLKKSPSLKRHLDSIDVDCWQDAIATLDGVIDVSIPPDQLVDWPTALTDDWFPDFC